MRALEGGGGKRCTPSSDKGDEHEECSIGSDGDGRKDCCGNEIVAVDLEAYKRKKEQDDRIGIEQKKVDHSIVEISVGIVEKENGTESD
jgi:hypothetical protein